MAMNIEFDAYKQKLNDCRPALEGLADSLNVEGLRNELERLHAMQEAPGFWDDPEKSQKIVVKTRQTENKIERYEKMLSAWDDLMTICEMAEEEDDDSMLEELQSEFSSFTEKAEAMRLRKLKARYPDSNIKKIASLLHRRETTVKEDIFQLKYLQREGRCFQKLTDDILNNTKI